MPLEDFTTYTEVDPNSHISKTAHHIDFDAYKNEDAWLRKDKGAGHFGSDWEQKIDVKPISASSQNYVYAPIWALTNDIDDVYGLQQANKTFIYILFRYDSTGTKKRVIMYEIYNGTEYYDLTVDAFFTFGTTYYLTIKKVGTALTCKIYSDSARTNLLDTLSLTLHADHSFRYIFPAVTYNTGSNVHFDVDVENLDLQEGQLYEIYKDTIVKVSATKKHELGISKDVAITSQALKAPEVTFNVPKDAIVKSLADLSFELGLPVEAVVQSLATKTSKSTYNISKDAIAKALTALSFELGIPLETVVKASAVPDLESTFIIQKDALVQALASVIVEKVAGQVFEIFKDAVVKAQVTFSLQSTFNISKDAISKATATVSTETIFNVVKDAIIKASTTPQILGVYPINVDALVNASATAQLQQTLGISKDAVVVSVSTPLIQSTFNISPEAVVKVLAVVDVGIQKVTKLYLLLGNVLIDLKTGDVEIGIGG